MHIDDIKRLTLKEGEVLIVFFKDNLTLAQIDDIRAVFKGLFPNNKLIVLDGDAQLGVIEKMP